MGCFLACFGSSKERESRKQRHKVRPRTRHQTHGSYKPVEATAIESDQVETPKKFATSLLRDDKSEEQLTLSARKKVTFDLNVTTYEHISDSEVEDEKTGESISKTEEEEKPHLENSGHPHSNAGPMSIKSHPPNNRYLNCGDIDDDNYEDETEEFEDDDSESDVDDTEYYNNSIENQPPPWVVESRNVNPTNISALVNHGPESMQLKRIIRDRSAYVHPVLNPVENLTQWKALKAGGPPPQMKQKLEEHPKHEEELCFSYRPKRDRRARNEEEEEEEVAVDASLSSWLGAAASDHNSTSSVSTTPVRSFEDRPILGALTVEELRQFSASSSPAKRSPCRSAEEEAPIIGSVGGYWGQQQQPTQVAKDSSPVSFKGIPNTTSKYREDKVVNWHSTPFEARLERALTRGGVAVDA